jgi:hypothetical protein
MSISRHSIVIMSLCHYVIATYSHYVITRYRHYVILSLSHYVLEYGHCVIKSVLKTRHGDTTKIRFEDTSA